MSMTSTVLFDFSQPASTGWSTGGGNPPYPWLRYRGSTPSRDTGPTAGPAGGSGFYYYCETSGGSYGQHFQMAYDGSACASQGSVIASVSFQLHMYGNYMGTLRLHTDALGSAAVWSRSGDQGNSWQKQSVVLFARSFRFDYMRGQSWSGDAAIAEVKVTCGHAPPPPPSPPLPPLPLSKDSMITSAVS